MNLQQKIRLLLGCGVFSVFCFSIACTHSRSEGPNLKETIEWINQTYNPSPEEMSYKNHGIYESQVLENSVYVTVDRKSTILRLNGCAVTIEGKQDPNRRMSADLRLV